MKITEITPKKFHCGIGACPAIFETSDGKYILIGKVVPAASAMRELDGRIGPDEIAVEIPRDLLSNLVQRKS